MTTRVVTEDEMEQMRENVEQKRFVEHLEAWKVMNGLRVAYTHRPARREIVELLSAWDCMDNQQQMRLRDDWRLVWESIHAKIATDLGDALACPYCSWVSLK